MSWKEYNMGELIEQIRGISYKKNEVTNSSFKGAIAILKANNISNTFQLNQDDLIYISTSKVKDKQKLKKGDILIATSSGSINVVGKGAAYDLNGEHTFGAFCKVLRPTSKKALPDLIAYYFQSDYYRKTISNLARGANINNLKNEHVNNLKIKLPVSLKEQEKLLKILDRSQLLVRKRNESVQLLEELLKSTFHEMFGDPVLNQKEWRKVALRDLGNWHSGGTPSRSVNEYFNGDIPWYSSGELNDIYVKESNEKITQSAIDNTSAKLVNPGSLLIAMYDTAALKSSITKKKSSCNQAIAFAKLDEKKCSTIYVYFAIQLGRKYYLTQRRGVRQRNLNLSMVKNFELPLPSLSFQIEFEQKFLKIFSLKEKALKSLEDSKNLFNSLLHDVFSQNLTFQEDNLELLSAFEKIKWFDQQLVEITGNDAVKKLQDNLDRVSKISDQFSQFSELQEKIKKLNIPSLDKITELQIKLQKLETPQLKHIKSFESFKALQEDELIKKVTQNKSFHLKSYDDFLEEKRQKDLEEEIRKEQDPILNFIGQSQIGRFTIDNYQINVAKAIHEYFKGREFSLTALRDLIINEHGVTVKVNDLKKDVFKMFTEFIQKKFGSLFGFKDMREEMKRLLFNPEFELLQEFIDDKLRKGQIEQVFLESKPDEAGPNEGVSFLTSTGAVIPIEYDRVYLHLREKDEN